MGRYCHKIYSSECMSFDLLIEKNKVYEQGSTITLTIVYTNFLGLT